VHHTTSGGVDASPPDEQAWKIHLPHILRSEGEAAFLAMREKLQRAADKQTHLATLASAQAPADGRKN
jgi:hypothetical protein